MSTQRIAKEAGWVSTKQLPKGPNGRALCRQCSNEVPPGRRTFCSADCVDRWSLKTNPGYVRDQVLKRDKGVCAICGVDAVALANQTRYQWKLLRRQQLEASRSSSPDFTVATAAVKAFEAANPLLGAGRVSWWDADHIVPVVEGGGECDLDNYRTLCIPCHRRVTADLRKRMAERKRLLKAKTTTLTARAQLSFLSGREVAP